MKIATVCKFVFVSIFLIAHLFDAYFQVTVSPVKEPYAFKKVRQKLELKQSFHASSKGGVASCGSAIITPKELEFIPLEAPLGKERGPGELQCCTAKDS